MEILRENILIEIARYTGKTVKADFIKNTIKFIPHIERFHNLITGIYKPAWSEYAISIVMKINSPYEKKDNIYYLKDGRWLMSYSPRSGGLEHSDNCSLVKCMEDKVPLIVFRQITDKKDKKYGSTYEVTGLALITEYNSKDDVFIVESLDISSLKKVTSIIPEEENCYEVQLYAQLCNQFQPFVKEDKVEYTVNLPKRDKAFRHIILKEYNFTCAVCNMKFKFGSLIETTAAHIIPKQRNGTDDPRNGLSLCRTHHWAFDEGIFSLSDDYEVITSPVLRKAEMKNFCLIDLKDKQIVLPESKSVYPHKQSLLWHRDEVLLK